MQALLSRPERAVDAVSSVSPVFSRGGFPIGVSLPGRAYWALKLRDGSWWCEEDEVSDFLKGRRRLDWTLDIVSTGDIYKVTEIWLFCPPTLSSPTGSRARLPISIPGTAFQLKVAQLDTVIADSQRNLEAQLIGRVDTLESGDCTAFIYDYRMQAMGQPWRSNVYRFGTWRDGIAPIGALSHSVLGLRLEGDATPKLAVD